MSSDVERFAAAEPSDVRLPSAALRRRFDRYALEAGIADRGHFASGWAQRKQKQFDTRFEAKIGTPNFLPFGVLRLAVQLGRSVCKIEAVGVNHNGRAGAWSGTGLLVADGMLLTNHHVLNSAGVARHAEAIFDYEDNGPTEATKPRRFSLAPE